MTTNKLFFSPLLLALTACGGSGDITNTPSKIVDDASEIITETIADETPIEITIPRYNSIAITGQNVENIAKTTYEFLQYIAKSQKDETDSSAVRAVTYPTTFTLSSTDPITTPRECKRSGTQEVSITGDLYKNDNGISKIAAPGSMLYTMNNCSDVFLKYDFVVTGSSLLTINKGSHGWFDWHEIDTKITEKHTKFAVYNGTSKEVLEYQNGEISTHFKKIDDLQTNYSDYYQKKKASYGTDTQEYMLNNVSFDLLLESGSYDSDKIYTLSSNSLLFDIALADWQGKLQATLTTSLVVSSDNDLVNGAITLQGTTGKAELSFSGDMINYSLDSDNDGTFETTGNIDLTE